MNRRDIFQLGHHEISVLQANGDRAIRSEQMSIMEERYREKLVENAPPAGVR